MRVVIIGLIFAAVMLAGGTAYLLRDYLSSQQAEIAAMAPKAPTIKVLVTAADMPMGTAVNANNAVWVDWPEDGIQDGYLVKTGDADPLAQFETDKFVSRRAFVKGEPITMARLYKATDPGFLRGSMAPGMRAIAVRSTAETASAGFILPGDRVDVMLTHGMMGTVIQSKGLDPASTTGLGLQHTSETIMKDLRILAVDQKVNEFEGGAMVGKTVLLEVTPKQAEMLGAAKAMGLITLVLRSAETGEPDYGRSFSTDVEVSPMLSNFSQFLEGGQAPSTASKAAAPTNTAPVRTYAKPKRSSKITVYRGTTGGAASTGTAAQ